MLTDRQRRYLGQGQPKRWVVQTKGCVAGPFSSLQGAMKFSASKLGSEVVVLYPEGIAS